MCFRVSGETPGKQIPHHRALTACYYSRIPIENAHQPLALPLSRSLNGGLIRNDSRERENGPQFPAPARFSFFLSRSAKIWRKTRARARQGKLGARVRQVRGGRSLSRRPFLFAGRRAGNGATGKR